MMPLAAIDWHGFFFLLFALLACGFGVAVVATSNVVRMAFYLTLSLGATAGLFFLAGAQFVGAMQFMIYVGGTLVLLIFGVMLTAQSNFISMKTAAGEWIAGGILGAALLLLLVRAGVSVEDWRTPRKGSNELTVANTEHTAALGQALVGLRVDKLNGYPDRPPAPRANSLSGYLLPFVIVSMHLLVVLVGAGYLARTKRRGTGPAAARTLETARPTQRHSLTVTGGIVSGIVVNVVLGVLMFTFPDWSTRLGAEDGSPTAQAIHHLSQQMPAGLPMILAVLFALNVLLLVVVWQWQRWGVIGLVIVSLVLLGLLLNTPLDRTLVVILFAITFVPAVALLGLLLQGGRQSAWSRME
jgi:NADH-quinone oxidoreductase subunit J